MTQYPILFNVTDPVIGSGFVAGVKIEGRVLMREEPDGRFWVDGVYPGAISAGGASRDEALLKLREGYRSVLFDFASAASCFEDFKAEVERFFWETTPGEPEAWKEAAAALRADRARAGEWLRVTSSYSEPSLMVVRLWDEDFQAGKNSSEQVELAAEAA
jgi:hypothetical protein